jgi:hypothetical protein
MPHYVRYVDDFVILDPDPGKLVRIREEIGEFVIRS